VPAALKAALEDLLRARRLAADLPPLRGEELRRAFVPTGISALDNRIGGFPLGQLSEVHGPASSGRTGLLLALVARSTSNGALAAWVDPADRFCPESAAAAGADLARLLWLRGRALAEALQATSTLLGSGLFEVTVLDLAGVHANELRRLPAATWIRLERVTAEAKTALVLIAAEHVACGPGGARVALTGRPRWSGAGAGRLLRGLDTVALSGRHVHERAAFALQAL